MEKILEELVKDIAKKKKNVSDLLEALIREAFHESASDIHLEHQEDKKMLLRYRIDGILHDIFTIDKDVAEDLVFMIKVKAKLRTDVHFSPQDGKIGFAIVQGGEETTVKIDARVSIVPITHGQKVVIRLLAQQKRALTLEELGFSKDDIKKIQKGYKRPYGLILSTGPTGSGKTTTLYSMLSILNAREVNITTVEDPVEFSIKGVNHIQINPKADLTFVNGLRSILRQDPNIIMVGEIRDEDTAVITSNAALTGHLVLSTLHANDAISTIPRLLNLGIESFLLATIMNVIISQRLCRRLCQSCKRESVLGKDLVQSEMLKTRPDISQYLKKTDKIYKSVGCDKCRKRGYRGRIGVYEILELTPKIREALTHNMTTDEVFEIARKEGFKLMIEDGIEKIKQGNIDISELMKVISIKE